MVNKSFETVIALRIKDGTDTHIKRFTNKDMQHDGSMADPVFMIRVLESAIITLKAECEQTSLIPLPDDGCNEEPQTLGAALKADAGEKKKPGRKPKEHKELPAGQEGTEQT